MLSVTNFNFTIYNFNYHK